MSRSHFARRHRAADALHRIAAAAPTDASVEAAIQATLLAVDEVALDACRIAHRARGAGGDVAEGVRAHLAAAEAHRQCLALAR